MQINGKGSIPQSAMIFDIWSDLDDAGSGCFSGYDFGDDKHKKQLTLRFRLHMAGSDSRTKPTLAGHDQDNATDH